MMAIEHIEEPLSWSDQPGYRLTFLGFDKAPEGAHVVDMAMEVEAVEDIGFWQPGWILSWFREPKAWRRAFVGYYVWSDCRTGHRVPLNLENALIQLRLKAQDAA